MRPLPTPVWALQVKGTNFSLKLLSKQLEATLLHQYFFFYTNSTLMLTNYFPECSEVERNFDP